MSSLPPDGQIKRSTEGETGYVFITHRKTEFEVYHVSKEDLDRLVSGFTSIHFGLFGISAGAFVAFYTTYTTVMLDEAKHSQYFTLSVIFGLASVYFGIMAIRDYVTCRKDIKRIKSATVTEKTTVRSTLS